MTLNTVFIWDLGQMNQLIFAEENLVIYLLFIQGFYMI